MICLVALIAFGFLAVFSAKHRPLAKEAFDCVLRRITLRPCTSRLDQRLKAKIVGKTLLHSKTAAKIVHRHFELLSWAFTILTIISIALILLGIFNFYAYGNCNGPNATESCILTDVSQGNFDLGKIFGINLLFKTPEIGNSPVSGNPNAQLTLIEFGCFSCQYSKAAEPKIQELLKKYDGKLKLVFKVFPLPNHPFSHESAEASLCAEEQGKYWEMHNALFEKQVVFKVEGIPALKKIANEIGLNQQQFDGCLDSKKYFQKVEDSFNEGLEFNIGSTPTFFLGNQMFVGMKDMQRLEDEIARRLQ